MGREPLRFGPATIKSAWRLAYEASDAGLLIPDLAAGKRLGVRTGNWITAALGPASPKA
jgi:hypothetical protein